MSKSLTALVVLAGLMVLPSFVAVAQSADAEMLPPNAKPGECYARVFVPPAYETETEKVLVKEASENVNVIPARSEYVNEKVLVKEASERIEIVPATYEWVTEKVMVKPASKKIVEVPAKYDIVTEKVVDKPAHTVWKKGTGPIQKVDHSTGEIMCLVEVPASYKTVTRKVLKAPATTREMEIPAEYTTVRKQVVKTPPSTRKVAIPAEYKTVRVLKEIEPPKVKKSPVPAEYRTVTRTVMVSDGKMDWKPVLCQTNMSASVVTDVQRALRAAGHNPGPIDGRVGSQTLNALKSYQIAKGLPRGGMTHETLMSLGVSAGR